MKLFFDHLYRVLNTHTFDSLKKIHSDIPGASYAKKDTNNGSWEGIYIRLKDGTYLEFLKEDEEYKSNYISLCLSQFGNENKLHQKLIDHYPDHHFKFYDTKTPEGEPWMHGSMFESPVENVFLFALDYQGKKAKERKSYGKEETVFFHTVDQIDFKLNKDQFDHFEQICEWFSEKTIKTKNSIEVRIPQIEHGFLSFVGHFKQNEADSSYFKIKGKCNSYGLANSTINQINDIKDIEFEINQNTYKITYSKSE